MLLSEMFLCTLKLQCLLHWWQIEGSFAFSLLPMSEAGAHGQAGTEADPT
jgi:hypothetical protein